MKQNDQEVSGKGDDFIVVDVKACTQILSGIPMELLTSWKKSIECIGEIEVIHTPNMGLVMMRAEESVARDLFNVGEILISDATVSVDGVMGYGITMGNSPDKAYALALIDAVFHADEAKWGSVKRNLADWLTEQGQEQKIAAQKRFSLTRRTLVDFEVMDDD
ncbi:phosphonate C-P lyase system protein PhnG [Paenibacillus pini]|uniref:phosphonate C-P lyase system protein PhnG n=1 Tax=Paenibacillus pini TaxID=669461 RepID=UPI000690765F|nr:phosphonate C-P lyase system protein PhnG [Paenibacillus pini]